MTLLDYALKAAVTKDVLRDCDVGTRVSICAIQTHSITLFAALKDVKESRQAAIMLAQSHVEIDVTTNARLLFITSLYHVGMWLNI